MACTQPLLFLDLGLKENGKRWLKMLSRRMDDSYRSLCDKYGSQNILQVPCGKCPSCIKAYRRQWSLRCEAEARMHQENCYITLTYDEEHVPDVICKKDVSNFIRSLRDSGIKLRYFACCEYGENTSRPHAHAILFGYMPKDLKYQGKTKTGFPYFSSVFLDSKWKKGFVTVEMFAPEAAGYVAGYVDKKLEEGTKEACLIMSNRPGIGAEYYRRHMMQLLESDNFVSKNGFVAPLPRYVEKLADQMWFDISDVKQNRQVKGNALTMSQLQDHGFSNLEELLKYKADTERRKKKYARNL